MTARSKKGHAFYLTDYQLQCLQHVRDGLNMQPSPDGENGAYRLYKPFGLIDINWDLDARSMWQLTPTGRAELASRGML